MPILATGQISIVDLSDGKSLSCYITSNLPKTQIYDPNPGGRGQPGLVGHAQPDAHPGDLCQPDRAGLGRCGPDHRPGSAGKALAARLP